jgi:hypothetical protein
MKTSKHRGNQAAKPDESKLNQLGAFTLAVPEARAILRKAVSKYPRCHTIYSEETWLGLIVEFLQTPGILDATWKPKTKAQKEFILPAHKAKAIQWAKMFAEAPLIMMDVLPKIHKCLNKFVNRPMLAVVTYYAQRHDLQKFYGRNDFCERFWTEKSNSLALELKSKLRIDAITRKTIEHARAYIRKSQS